MMIDHSKNLPESPGVYFFKDGKGKILYIGKATSLRSRVRSYFAGDILERRGPFIEQMTMLAKKIDFEKTDSVLEALIVEAELIKKYKPKYNTDLKDDKSFNYIVITKEEFPRVLVIRGRTLFTSDQLPVTSHQFGPFPNGDMLKEGMKIVRKIFPFRDTCIPNRGKPCFNAQIGLCPGVCTGAISKKEYAKTIRNITLFFEGRKKKLISGLEKEMRSFAKSEEFEKADAVKKTIFSLSHIRDVSLLKKDFYDSEIPLSGFRMEFYDIAHLSGRFTSGAMSVVEDGEAKKNEYRKFKIKEERGVNDTAHLSEIIDRRLSHTEWKYPHLIVVDGGIAQKNAAESLLGKYGIRIPVLGVVKDEHHRPKTIIGDQTLARKYEKEILLGNNEVHRFAIGYHRKLRGKIGR